MKYIGHNLRYLDTPIKRIMYLVKIEIKIFSTTVKCPTYSRVRLIFRQIRFGRKPETVLSKYIQIVFLNSMGFGQKDGVLG